MPWLDAPDELESKTGWEPKLKNGSETKYFMTPQEPTTYDGRRMLMEDELVALEFGWNLMNTQV